MENSDKIAEIEKISNEIERCMNLFPQKDYLHKSYSSKGFDNDDVSKSQAKRLAKRKKMHPDNLKSITEKLQDDETDDDELSGDDGNCIESQSWVIETLKPEDPRPQGPKELKERLNAKLMEKMAARKSKKRTPEEQMEITKRRKLEKARYKKKKKRLSQQINGNKNGAGFHDENKLSQPETKVNKSENFVYSKFDLATKATVEDTKPKNKLKRKAEAMLSIASKKKKQMERTREKNPEKADRLEAAQEMKRAELKASGEKLKDDIGLLKKTLKKKEQRKKKSKKEWAERNQKVEEKHQRKQDRRSRNIQNKKDKKKAFRKNGF